MSGVGRRLAGLVAALQESLQFRRVLRVDAHLPIPAIGDRCEPRV